MRLLRSNKGTATVPLAGGRSNPGTVILDNRVRTHRLIITVSGVLTVAGGPAGAVRNGGRLSAALSHALNENGQDTYGPIRARMLRAISEYDAGQPLAGAVLPASGALPIGVYNLSETYEMAFADRRLINPAETAYLEADPTSFFQLDTYITNGATAAASLVAPAGGSTQVLTDVRSTVEQVYAPAAGISQLPIWKKRYREISQTISGANPAEIVRVNTDVRLRRLVLSQELTVTADGGVIITDDVINAARLIGDTGVVIGPNQSAYNALLESQRLVAGGDVTAEGATFLSDFADDGRLANTIIPRLQFPNFRYELDSQPSVLAVGTSRVVVGIEELYRPAGGQYPQVTPQLPEWAIPFGQ